MAINKTILLKIKEKTADKPEIGDFLIELLRFESSERGWYKQDYNKFLDEFCRKEKENANNRNQY